MRKIAAAFVIVLVALVAMSLAGVAAGRSSASKGPHAVMSVTGTAAKGATILYGTAWSTYHDGKFPFHSKIAVFQAQYSYFVTGTLKHGGSITCKITIGSATKTAYAKGGHKSCTARLTTDNKGGWQ